MFSQERGKEATVSKVKALDNSNYLYWRTTGKFMTAQLKPLMALHQGDKEQRCHLPNPSVKPPLNLHSLLAQRFQDSQIKRHYRQCVKKSPCHLL